MASAHGREPHRRQDEVRERALTEAPPWASANAPTAYRAGAGFYREQDEGVAARLPSGVVLVAGIWLVVAPFALADGSAGLIIQAAWGDILVGLALSALALARFVAPRKRPWLSLVNVVIGAWLVAVVGLPVAWPGLHVVNNIIVGIVVVLMATSSTSLTLLARRHAGRSVALGTASPPSKKE